jgi:alpha-methylacyl-CoA racemase
MMLADHGAEVIRIDRHGSSAGYVDVLNRSRRMIEIDMKRPGGVDLVRRLVRGADGLIEGFRPGVAERLGLGPDVLLEDNPRLVYGRMTGWGQQGPLAQAAGHDLNYVALSGVLHAMGDADANPPVPLNLIGDFGGGGMMLAFGMVAALLAVARGGPGEVVDAAITDGAALLGAMFHSTGGAARWHGPRGTNMLDGSAPFYSTYRTSDGGFITLGAIEGPFYRDLIARLGLAGDPDFTEQMDRTRWPAAKARLAELFASHRRDHWCALLEGTDACFAPVLSREEAISHPHNAARGTFIEAFGVVQPAPAPRYRGMALNSPTMSTAAADRDELLKLAGLGPQEIEMLRGSGVVS